jgi:hypothetical protein
VPGSIRRSQLYQSLVDTTLRFLIEQVGGVEGVFDVEGILPEDFLARRTAGNLIEALGIVAFRASPVWVLAALADVCGAGRQVIPDVSAALKARGLLEEGSDFVSVDQLLDGLQRSSARLAETINTPPLDVAGLRKEWQAIRDQARALPAASLPSRDAIRELWQNIKAESVRQERSVFETSSVMAVSAVRAGAAGAGRILAQTTLDHYTQTLSEIRQLGYVKYLARQLGPYLRGAANQFSPKHRTLTERAIDRLRSRR